MQLVEKSAAILHQPAAAVNFPLSLEDEQDIGDMLYSIQPPQLKAVNAPWDRAAGMAAVQWGIPKQIFLYADDKDGFEVIINPTYKAASQEMVEGWEGCFSVPFATGLVLRYASVDVEYYDMKGQKITKRIEGWPARVFQHETDHLKGLLYDSLQTCLDFQVFNSQEEVMAFRASVSRKP